MDSGHSYRALRYIAGNETAIKDIAQTINTLNADAKTVKLHPFPDQQPSGAKDIVSKLKTVIDTIRLKTGQMKCSGATMFHCVSALTASLPKLSATYTFGTLGYRYNPFFEHSNTASEIYIDKIIAAVKTTIEHPIIKRAFVTAAIQTYIHNEQCQPSFATGLAAFPQRVGKVTVCCIDAGSLTTAMEQNTWLTASSITL